MPPMTENSAIEEDLARSLASEAVRTGADDLEAFVRENIGALLQPATVERIVALARATNL